MLALTFRIHRPAAIGSVTAGRKGVFLHTWCNLETDFVRVLASSDKQADHTMATIVDRFGPNVVHAKTSRAPGHGVLVPCPANPTTSVSVTVERHGGLMQPPIVSADGWDTFNAIVLDDERAPALLRAIGKLGKLELLAKKPVDHLSTRGFFVPSMELLDRLTRRQAEAIVSAANMGYYEEPRSTTIATLAKGAGVGRASLEEHLRKAENKVMTALAPFVAMHTSSLKPTKSRGVPFAGKRRQKRDGANDRSGSL